jgi:hypothetical protein
MLFGELIRRPAHVSPRWIIRRNEVRRVLGHDDTLLLGHSREKLIVGCMAKFDPLGDGDKVVTT